jgi:hypothetical protein
LPGQGAADFNGRSTDHDAPQSQIGDFGFGDWRILNNDRESSIRALIFLFGCNYVPLKHSSHYVNLNLFVFSS